MVINFDVSLSLPQRSVDSYPIVFARHFCGELLDRTIGVLLYFDGFAGSKGIADGREVSLIPLDGALQLGQFPEVGDLALLPQKAPYHV